MRRPPCGALGARPLVRWREGSNGISVTGSNLAASTSCAPEGCDVGREILDQARIDARRAELLGLAPPPRPHRTGLCAAHHEPLDGQLELLGPLDLHEIDARLESV